MAKQQKSKRGSGSVHLRKDGRWEGRVVIGRNEKDLPITKNVLAKTKRECEQKLKALRDSLQGDKPEPPKAGMTFGAWLDYWYQNDCNPKSSILPARVFLLTSFCFITDKVPSS